MPCLYCGKELAFLKRLTGGDFCSDEHRRRYRRDVNDLALSRLLQAHTDEPDFDPMEPTEEDGVSQPPPETPEPGAPTVLPDARQDPEPEPLQAAPAGAGSTKPDLEIVADQLAGLFPDAIFPQPPPDTAGLPKHSDDWETRPERLAALPVRDLLPMAPGLFALVLAGRLDFGPPARSPERTGPIPSSEPEPLIPRPGIGLPGGSRSVAPMRERIDNGSRPLPRSRPLPMERSALRLPGAPGAVWAAGPLEWDPIECITGELGRLETPPLERHDVPPPEEYQPEDYPETESLRDAADEPVHRAQNGTPPPADEDDGAADAGSRPAGSDKETSVNDSTPHHPDAGSSGASRDVPDQELNQAPAGEAAPGRPLAALPVSVHGPAQTRQRPEIFVMGPEAITQPRVPRSGALPLRPRIVLVPSGAGEAAGESETEQEA